MTNTKVRPRKGNAATQSLLRKARSPSDEGTSFVYDRMNIARAFNWYAANGDVKEMKVWVADWMAQNGYSTDQIEKYNKSESWRTTTTMGAIADLLRNGCKLSSGEPAFLKDRVDEVLRKTVIVPEVVTPVETQAVDFLIDEFGNRKYKVWEPNVHDHLRENGLKAYQVPALVKYLKEIEAELYAEDAKEHFSHLTDRQFKNYQVYLGWLIGKVKSFANAAPKRTIIRRKKIKPAKALAGKIIYQERDARTKVISKSPESVVGANTVWLYNSKQRRLVKLVGGPKGLTIKGAKVSGFDESKCFAKRVSKARVISNIATTTRAAAEKMSFDGVDVRLTGIINKDTLVLRVDK